MSNEMNKMEQLLLYLNKTGRACSLEEAAEAVEISAPGELEELAKTLESRGRLVITPEGKLLSARQAGVYVCRLLSYSEHFAFARPDDGSDDIFIDSSRLNGALPGDTVLVGKVRQKVKGPSGEVVRVLLAGPHKMTGKLVRAKDKKGFALLADSSYRFPIPVRYRKKQTLRTSDKAIADISIWRGSLQADVTKVYGEADSARICADSILDGRSIPTVFPPDVLREAETLGSREITREETASRLDLRDEPIFTIDGADAKDLDDAISVRKTDKGWALGVHIADVSHYVRSGTAVDLEARRRGTSVYFADRVVPMLPEVISNGVCSLNAGTDKLAFSALMQFDERGGMTDYRFAKTLIRSKVRGVYSEVNSIFAGNAEPALLQKYAPVAEGLGEARKLAKVLHDRASANGTMELETSEPRFELDENGVCVAMFARKSGEAEQMIEQLMIAANQAAAKLAAKMKLPFVYRVHEEPSPDRIDTLRELTGMLGLDGSALKPGVTPKEISALLKRAAGTKYMRIISHQVLRTMAKARYDCRPLGHYGLALSDYCHFTSPIRRYPDTSIHRVLSDFCAGESVNTLQKRYGTFVEESAALSSEFEIRAMGAERAAEDCYCAEYLSQHLGEEFDGTVCGVTEWGIYIELECSAEGFVRAVALPRGYEYDGALAYRRGAASSLTIGDPMRVRVIRADISAGQVDFLPVEEGDV